MTRIDILKLDVMCNLTWADKIKLVFLLEILFTITTFTTIYLQQLNFINRNSNRFLTQTHILYNKI